MERNNAVIVSQRGQVGDLYTLQTLACQGRGEARRQARPEISGGAESQLDQGRAGTQERGSKGAPCRWRPPVTYHRLIWALASCWLGAERDQVSRSQGEGECRHMEIQGAGKKSKASLSQRERRTAAAGCASPASPVPSAPLLTCLVLHGAFAASHAGREGGWGKSQANSASHRRPALPAAPGIAVVVEDHRPPPLGRQNTECSAGPVCSVAKQHDVEAAVFGPSSLSV